MRHNILWSKTKTPDLPPTPPRPPPPPRRPHPVAPFLILFGPFSHRHLEIRKACCIRVAAVTRRSLSSAKSLFILSSVRLARYERQRACKTLDTFSRFCRKRSAVTRNAWHCCFALFGRKRGDAAGTETGTGAGTGAETGEGWGGVGGKKSFIRGGAETTHKNVSGCKLLRLNVSV